MLSANIKRAQQNWRCEHILQTDTYNFKDRLKHNENI